MKEDMRWDVVVVGGGPAGMLAAGTAASRGAKVVLIEKNATLGRKLLITGGGRCNITNSQFDTRKLLEKFHGNGKFLFSAFAQWGVKETLDFFHAKGMPTKVENELRTFPVSNTARSVWEVLVAYMKEHGVTVLADSPVVELVRGEDGTLAGVKLKNKRVVHGRAIVLATGGTSRPETGSTGDGYTWLEKIGHTVTPPTPSLVPLALKDRWVKKCAGTTLTGIKITVLQNNEKQLAATGKILFTHVGVSGPTILNMSKDIEELLKYGEVFLSLDLFPARDHGALGKKLQSMFDEHPRRKLANTLSGFIPPALVSIVLQRSTIDPETKCSGVTREHRTKLVSVLKAFSLQVDKLLGVEKAIITSGGVVLEEVDFKTMRSRLFPNLYLIGDILNIDRPSGGYSLQLCWTTGFVAGKSATAR